MSLSPLVSFKSRFVTCLLNFPRIINSAEANLHLQILRVLNDSIQIEANQVQKYFGSLREFWFHMYLFIN